VRRERETVNHHKRKTILISDSSSESSDSAVPNPKHKRKASDAKLPDHGPAPKKAKLTQISTGALTPPSNSWTAMKSMVGMLDAAAARERERLSGEQCLLMDQMAMIFDQLMGNFLMNVHLWSVLSRFAACSNWSNFVVREFFRRERIVLLSGSHSATTLADMSPNSNNDGFSMVVVVKPGTPTIAQNLLSSVSTDPNKRMVMKNLVFIPPMIYKCRPDAGRSLARLMPAFAKSVTRITFVDVTPTPQFLEGLKAESCQGLTSIDMIHPMSRGASCESTSSKNEHQDTAALETLIKKNAPNLRAFRMIDMSFTQLGSFASSFATKISVRASDGGDVIASLTLGFNGNHTVRLLELHFMGSSMMTTLSQPLNNLRELEFDVGNALTPQLEETIESIYKCIQSPVFEKVTLKCQDPAATTACAAAAE
jgi:hypothetical protein